MSRSKSHEGSVGVVSYRGFTPWCEASRLANAVRVALEIGTEVIVADPASPDGTATLARAAGARVISARAAVARSLMPTIP